MNPLKYRGVRNAIVLFFSYAGSIGAFFGNAKPEWGPLLGSTFGCFAVGIGVQQAYAHVTEAKRQSTRQYVYLWSSWSLFFFGIGTIAACLPNIGQAGMPQDIQRISFATSTGLIAFGFITLFRFAATYLYRDTDQLSGNKVVAFKWKKIVSLKNGGELLHAIICVLVAVTALAYFFLAPPLSLTDIEKPVYFPFAVSKFALCMAGVITAICLILFFKAKYRRIVEGKSELEGLRFMTAMAILFFLPPIMQAIALSPLVKDLGWEESWIAGGWCVVLGVTAGVILVATFGVDGDGSEDSAGVQSASKHASGSKQAATIQDANLEPANPIRSLNIWLAVSLILCAGIAFLMFARHALLQVIPFGFVTLGCLTLACAYLPIDDLERVKKQRSTG